MSVSSTIINRCAAQLLPPPSFLSGTGPLNADRDANNLFLHTGPVEKPAFQNGLEVLSKRCHPTSSLPCRKLLQNPHRSCSQRRKSTRGRTSLFGRQTFLDTLLKEKNGRIDWDYRRQTRFRATQSLEETVDRPLIDLSYLELRNVGYQPPGCEKPILNDVNFVLDKHSLGLIFGRSGSGKTTLLQILAGLAAPTTGSLHIHSARFGTRGPPLSVSDVSARTGLVFQFPERYFLADTIADELLFGHVRSSLRTEMYRKVVNALHAVGMDHIPMDTAPRALSDGYKRRLALAVQLVRQPDILLLDEPLAGLDWQARMDVVQLLEELKRTTTLIVVSHDLRELAPLVDKAWRMQVGGRLEEAEWPLQPGSQRLELSRTSL